MGKKSALSWRWAIDTLGISGFILTLLGFLGFTWPALLSALPDDLSVSPPSQVVTISYWAGAAALGAVVALFWVRRRDMAVRHLPQGYVWREATFDYYVPALGEPKHTLDSRVNVRATRNGVDLIEIRHQFSGSGAPPQPLRVREGAREVLGPFQREGFHVYYLLLNYELNRGREATIRFTQDFLDPKGTFEPHLSKITVEQIRRLRMIVHFVGPMPDEHCVAVKRYKGAYPARKEARTRLTAKYDPDHREISLLVNRPRLNNNYDIRWDGPNGCA